MTGRTRVVYAFLFPLAKRWTPAGVRAALRLLGFKHLVSLETDAVRGEVHAEVMSRKLVNERTKSRSYTTAGFSVLTAELKT